MRIISVLILAAHPASTALTSLYVASYGDPTGLGKITELQLEMPATNLYSLSRDFAIDTSLVQPSWLTTDSLSSRIFLVDEADGHGGAVLSYDRTNNMTLIDSKNLTIIGGPVHAVTFYNNSALAIADYVGARMHTFTVAPDGKSHASQVFQFTDPAYISILDQEVKINKAALILIKR